MKRLTFSLLATALLIAGVGTADAAQIAFFSNSSYVDTSWEGPNMRADIVALGHTVTDFSGTSAADFAAAVAGGAILVFPEMEIDNLFANLDAGAKAFLTGFVSGGGTMVQANAYYDNANLANGLFGFGLSQTGSMGSPTTLDAAAAAGTAFAGGPASLPDSSAVEGILSSSLPVGARNLYHDGTTSSVFVASYGAGQYIYLGFDWFDTPRPGEWMSVLDSALGSEPDPVPEPGTLMLLGSAMALGARRLRAARRK